jgi:predicted dehydrogenase
MSSENGHSVDGNQSKKIRYAVVGLGHLAQVAVLPAFANATDNSELTALVSSDPEKLAKLGKKYKVKNLYSYDQYDECLRSGEVDAVYIVLPNDMHCDYTVRAANAGVHVLCEKPMAITEAECREMIDACDKNNVRLMIAYRLLLEESTLNTMEQVRSGAIGEPKYFTSDFSQQASNQNYRLKKGMGGGPVYDIGVYCINAARCLFDEEPIEVSGIVASSDDPRFEQIEETATVVMRFPKGRVAAFTCSFGAAPVMSYRITGTEGDLRIDPAYGYVGKITQYLTAGGKTKKTAFATRDQFAPQLLYLSDCILKGVRPEPSGEEGLADIRVVEAFFRSAAEGRPVALEPIPKINRPIAREEFRRPPIKQPALVNAKSPARDKGN